MNDDEGMRDLLTVALRGAERPVGPTTDELVARGRRSRSRRRIAVSASALVVAGAMVGTAVLVDADADRAVAPSASHGGSKQPADTTAPTPAPTVAVRAEPESGPQLLKNLERLLPPGTVTDVQSRGTGAGGEPPQVELDFNDGHGAAAITLELLRYTTPWASDAPGVTCAAWALDPDQAQQCSATDLADGNRFELRKGDFLLSTAKGVKLWSGYYSTPDGYQVELTEMNATVPTSSGDPLLGLARPTRSEPPLSEAEVESIVTSASWTPAVAAVQPSGPGVTSRDNGPNPWRSEIDATIAKALPAGFHATIGTNTDDRGFGQVIVSAGSRRVWLNVAVEQWSSGTSAAFAGINAGAQTLPDGSRLVLTQAVHPTDPMSDGPQALLLRPDGLRIIVSESGFGGGSPLLLTMDQLRSMVTSPLWQG